ncbi:Na+/melibiose symporter-like transporter [Microterricola gilva]|uniref:Na+/melibiose symporter-like transporter n=1 Tax=Microterricola gilva TaxID=393267 RepID=A0A4Q8ART4_9MICO|nr:MFS transporter [Microterricola gilva]RZU66825.1 Na+/melibiose symporter-like transporter [Microterricola gilva]
MSTQTPGSDVDSDGRTELSSTALRSPLATKPLLPSIAVTSVFLFATYAALTGILLPAQVALLDEDNKIANLAIVSTVSFIFTLFAQPIVGAFSDRTRSRLGRRAPWMLIGAAVAMIFLLGLGGMQNVLWITVFWVIIQVSLNALQGPMSAIVPDRFPRSRRGMASAMVGVGTMIGAALGTVAAAQFIHNIGVGYAVFGAGVLIVTILFVIINRDSSSVGGVVEPWSWKAFFAGFWISPKKSPDFAWAFAARFFFILGYFVIAAYNLYILTDYIKMPLDEAAASAGLLAMAGVVPTLISIVLAGWWSDKIGRRKVFIYAATIIMVIGLAMPLLMPNFTGMLLMGIINGFGFGLYMACDTALMTEVLPGDGVAAGKDLGILNVATNIPQAMSPAVAGIIISALGGYPALFVFGMVAVIIAAFVLVPIKSVR